MEPNSSPIKSSPLVPLAIIAGFTIVAVAIYFGGDKTNRIPANVVNQATPSAAISLSPVAPISARDYVRGNPNASVVIIEYSDYECPFCKQYHTVLRQVIDEYGATGRVAWVYRQLPVPQLHPNAPKISEAALCVGKLGGNSAFWNFSDALFDSRGLQDVINITRVPDMAAASGVSQSEFNRCYESGEMRPAVEASMREAFEAGIRVTPYTVIMVGNDVDVLEGTVSYDVLKGIVNDILAQLDGAAPNINATTTETGV